MPLSKYKAGKHWMPVYENTHKEMDIDSDQ